MTMKELMVGVPGIDSPPARGLIALVTALPGRSTADYSFDEYLLLLRLNEAGLIRLTTIETSSPRGRGFTSVNPVTRGGN